MSLGPLPPRELGRANACLARTYTRGSISDLRSRQGTGCWLDKPRVSIVFQATKGTSTMAGLGEKCWIALDDLGNFVGRMLSSRSVVRQICRVQSTKDSCRCLVQIECFSLFLFFHLYINIVQHRCRLSDVTWTG